MSAITTITTTSSDGETEMVEAGENVSKPPSTASGATVNVQTVSKRLVGLFTMF